MQSSTVHLPKKIVSFESMKSIPTTGTYGHGYENRKKVLVNDALNVEKDLQFFPQILHTVKNIPISEMADKIEELPDITLSGFLKKPFKNTYIAVRHGQTTGNLKNILSTGNRELKMDTATLLTDLGKRQVLANTLAFAKKNSFLKPEDVILISSDFGRAIQTADIIAEHLGVLAKNRKVSSLLRDRQFGIFDEKDAKFAHYIIMQNIIDPDWHLTLKPEFQHQTPESISDVFWRINRLIQELETQYSGKTIILATHHDTASIAYMGLNNLPVNKYWFRKPVANAEFLTI